MRTARPTTPSSTAVSCPTCRAPYRPHLTGWSCPVCDTAAPGAEGRRSRRLADDDRLLGVVLLATIANVVLLAVLSVVVVRVS